MIPEVLRTRRLILRRAREADAERLFVNYLTVRECTLYLARAPYTQVEQANRMLENWCNNYWDIGQEKFAWVIATADKDEAIGLFFIVGEKNQAIQIHYGISKQFQHQGLMTEAGKAVIKLLSSQRDLEKIVALSHVDNECSIALLKKLGFERQAILKEHLVFPAFGSFPCDCYYFVYYI